MWKCLKWIFDRLPSDLKCSRHMGRMLGPVLKESGGVGSKVPARFAGKITSLSCERSSRVRFGISVESINRIIFLTF